MSEMTTETAQAELSEDKRSYSIVIERSFIVDEREPIWMRRK